VAHDVWLWNGYENSSFQNRVQAVLMVQVLEYALNQNNMESTLAIQTLAYHRCFSPTPDV